MSNQRFEKLFSPEQANELIPRLEVLLRELHLEANRLRERLAALAEEEPALGEMAFAEVLDQYPELRPTAQRMGELAAQIESFGCLLKDIDQGLIDFPCQLNNEVVFLCWQYGEPQVSAWHTLDGGFAGRHPLPGAPKPYLN